MNNLIQDLKFALRMLAKRPGFTLAVVLTLAAGIGATTAIFSVVNQVLLKPLPYPEADKLAVIAEYPWIPAEIVLDLKETNQNFEKIAAYYSQQFAVSGGDEPYQLNGAKVTTNFLSLFQARMALGRDFSDTDVAKDAPAVAIISFEVWQSRYSESRDVIGQAIRVNGELHQIIGVVEQGFNLYVPRSDQPGLWIPFEVTPTNTEGLNNGLNYVIPIARLNEGSSLQQAQAELDVVLDRFRQRHPEMAERSPWNLHWEALKANLIQGVSTALLILQLAVGVMLLIACVNVANLLLVRFNSRRREMDVRSALGASRGRLFRQLLTETIVLYGLGGLAGLLLMAVMLEGLLSLAPQNIPRLGEVSVDVSVFLFTLAILLATGLSFGTLSAIAAMHSANTNTLGSERATTASKGQRRIGNGLVIVEVALALVLVVGAGLLGRSFFTLMGQDPGFRTEDITAISLQVPEHRYENSRQLQTFYSRVLERLQQIPAIESVGLAKNPPLNRGSSIREYQVEGTPEAEARGAQYDVVSSGYFDVLGIPLLRGRNFTNADRPDSLPAAIIDEAMWQTAWPGQDPIGRRFRFADEWLTVVGVVGSIRGSGLANQPGAGFYIPYRQRPDTPTALAVGRNAVLLIRSSADVQGLPQRLRQAIWDVDQEQPVPEILKLEYLVSQEVHPERFRTILLATFAGIALVLVMVGIYGVISYLVSERTGEIGLRRALGATQRNVLGMIMRQGGRLIVAGLGLGLLGALLLSRGLSSLLFGVGSADPLVYFLAALLLSLMAMGACVVPALHAARVTPVEALRYE